MAQLIVRRLAEVIVRRLRARAAQHGRSSEAEHREILRVVLSPSQAKSSLKQLLLAMPTAGRDHDFSRARDRRRPVKL